MTIVKIPGESPATYAARVRRIEIAVGNPDPGPSMADLLAAVRAGRQARSLNPCGQDSKGRFDSGNTCAAGDGAPGPPGPGPASLDKIFTVAGEKSPYGSSYETPTLPPALPPEQLSKTKSWAEVRAENMKHFDRLRKRIATLTTKTQEKYWQALGAREEAAVKLGALLREYDKLREQHDRMSTTFAEAAHQNGVATPQQGAEFQSTIEPISAKIKEVQLAMEPAEKALLAAQKALIKAKREASTATAKALGEESGRVLREDGRDSVAKSREREIKKWWKDNPERFVNLGAQRAHEASPDAEHMVEAGNAFLHEAMNADIHFAALKAPLYYLPDGERAHAVPGWDRGFQDGILAASRYEEVKKTDPGKAAGLWASSTHIAVAPGHVSVTPGNGQSTYMHEVGHQIEYGNREARELAVEFSTRRTAGDTDVVLKDRFPGYDFTPEEIGRPDDFGKTMKAVYRHQSFERQDLLAHYAGKRYDRFSSGATEIVSMGVELMAADAVKFAEADPEYFDLVAGILTGRALGGTRAAKIEASKPVPIVTGAQTP
jgi:hypothetical protein